MKSAARLGNERKCTMANAGSVFAHHASAPLATVERDCRESRKLQQVLYVQGETARIRRSARSHGTELAFTYPSIA
jgi:hypothetical protein